MLDRYQPGLEKNRALHLLLIICIGLGVFFRFWGLGLSSLSVDEYYLVKSIQFILDKGLPTFDAGGGYYTRGLIQQYLTAGALLLGGDLEWTSRLIPVLSNLAAIPAIYLLGKRLGGPVTACIAAGLFSLSLWEVEFSRFARMYAPFQALFLWYIHFMLQAQIEGKVKSLFIAFSLSIVGLFTYEGGVLLLALNFLPLFGQHCKPLARYMLLALIPLIGYYVSSQLFYYEGPDKLTEELMQHENAGVEFGLIFPPTLLDFALSSPIWTVPYLGTLIFAFYVLVTLQLRTSRWTLWSLLFSISLVSAAANQLGFAFIAAFTALLLHSSRSTTLPLPRKTLAQLALSLTLLCTYWFAFGLTNHEWIGEVGTLDPDRYPGKIVQLAGVLLNYPETITRFVLPWIEPIPLTSALLFGGFFGCFVLSTLKRDVVSDETRVVMAIAIASILFISAIDTIQKVSRYSFFIFPLFLLTFSIFICKCSELFTDTRHQKASILIAILTYGILAEDIGPKHLLNINSPEIMYRTAYTLKRQNHYYPRRDFDSPAAFINSHIKEGDIVISEDTSIDLYLNKKMDYIYLPWEQNRFWQRAVLGATKDRWTGASLVYKREDLNRLLENNKSIWLVVYSKDWMGLPITTFKDSKHLYPVFSNQDQTITVYKHSNDQIR